MAIFVENCAEKAVTGDNKIDFVDKKSITGRVIKEYSYQDFKENMNIICHAFFRLLYVCYGLLQFFATWAGLVKVFHQDNLIILLTSLVLGFLPFIGTPFGIYGAQIGWGWDLSYSIFIFVAPYFVANGPLLLIAFFDMYKDGNRWKMEEKKIN